MIEAAEISSAAYFIFDGMQELESIYRNYKIMNVSSRSVFSILPMKSCLIGEGEK